MFFTLLSGWSRAPSPSKHFLHNVSVTVTAHDADDLPDSDPVSRTTWTTGHVTPAPPLLSAQLEAPHGLSSSPQASGADLPRGKAQSSPHWHSDWHLPAGGPGPPTAAANRVPPAFLPSPGPTTAEQRHRQRKSTGSRLHRAPARGLLANLNRVTARLDSLSFDCPCFTAE
eukprot:1616547-Rhodomonas_salina.1